VFELTVSVHLALVTIALKYHSCVHCVSTSKAWRQLHVIVVGMIVEIIVICYELAVFRVWVIGCFESDRV